MKVLRYRVKERRIDQPSSSSRLSPTQYSQVFICEAAIKRVCLLWACSLDPRSSPTFVACSARWEWKRANANNYICCYARHLLVVWSYHAYISLEGRFRKRMSVKINCPQIFCDYFYEHLFQLCNLISVPVTQCLSAQICLKPRDIGTTSQGTYQQNLVSPAKSITVPPSRLTSSYYVTCTVCDLCFSIPAVTISSYPDPFYLSPPPTPHH